MPKINIKKIFYILDMLFYNIYHMRVFLLFHSSRNPVRSYEILPAMHLEATLLFDIPAKAEAQEKRAKQSQNTQKQAGGICLYYTPARKSFHQKVTFEMKKVDNTRGGKTIFMV